jgi:hypothetical protein
LFVCVVEIFPEEQPEAAEEAGELSGEIAGGRRRNQGRGLLIVFVPPCFSFCVHLCISKSVQILQEKAVKAALLRAQGVKVIDDPKLLRRKLKREEKQKQKSAKVWKERIGAQHAETAKRQEGRAANVRERQQKIVAKRLKKNKKTRKD